MHSIKEKQSKYSLNIIPRMYDTSPLHKPTQVATFPQINYKVKPVSLSTMLDMPAPPILDVPVLTLLDTPALLLTTPDLPEAAVHFTRSIFEPFNAHGFTALKPSNPHDPGPSTAAADQIRRLTYLAPFSSSINAAPLSTFSLIASRPTNPYDPGPSAAVTDKITAFSITPSITQFATHDYSRIPPRSPQCLFVMCFL